MRPLIAAPSSVIALVAAVVLIASPAARAQDDQSLQALRRENDELRQRIAQLEAQLAETRRASLECEQETERLNERIKELEAAAPASPDQPQDTPQEQPPGPRLAELPPGDPFVAPEALLQELKVRYDTAFGAVPMETDAQRQRVATDVRRWTRDMQRDLRGDIRWTVDVVRPTVDERGRDRVDVLVIDPASGLPYDEQPVPIADRRFVRTVLDNPTQRRWIVVGSVRAEPVFNADRLVPGMFDRPRFIGPMVEFGMEPSFRVVEPAPEAAQPTPTP